MNKTFAEAFKKRVCDMRTKKIDDQQQVTKKSKQNIYVAAAVFVIKRRKKCFMLIVFYVLRVPKLESDRKILTSSD